MANSVRPNFQNKRSETQKKKSISDLLRTKDEKENKWYRGRTSQNRVSALKKPAWNWLRLVRATISLFPNSIVLQQNKELKKEHRTFQIQIHITTLRTLSQWYLAKCCSFVSLNYPAAYEQTLLSSRRVWDERCLGPVAMATGKLISKHTHLTSTSITLLLVIIVLTNSRAVSMMVFGY